MSDSSPFLEAVNHYCDGLTVAPGICSACPECQSSYGMGEDELDTAYSNGDVCDEGVFSWRPCESCGSSLGGDRYDAHGLTADGEIIHLDICVDCLMLHANGDTPDEWEG